MIHVIAAIKVKPEFRDAFLEIFKANVPNVLLEQGCLGYEPTVDLPTGLPVQDADPDTITIIEKWESTDALTAHLSAPHMLDYKEKTKDMVIGLSVKILRPA